MTIRLASRRCCALAHVQIDRQPATPTATTCVRCRTYPHGIQGNTAALGETAAAPEPAGSIPNPPVSWSSVFPRSSRDFCRVICLQGDSLFPQEATSARDHSGLRNFRLWPRMVTAWMSARQASGFIHSRRLNLLKGSNMKSVRPPIVKLSHKAPADPGSASAPTATSGNGDAEKQGVTGGFLDFQRQKTVLKTGALQDAIFNSAYFS